MSKPYEVIEHDFDLPCHDNELSNAESRIDELKSRLSIIKTKKNIDDNTYTTMFEHIIVVLDYLGNLSLPAFETQNELEEMYKMKFLRSPELGKKLWLDHYGEIHKPYNKLKNRCYRLIDELDAEYELQHEKHPPNYKKYH